MARAALLALFSLPLLRAQTCPLNCNKRGVCDENLVCRCNAGWRGASCALRTCPRGPAWVGYGAGGTDDVHGVSAECSGVGSCNTKTGACACPAGFTGAACQTLGCPGQGRCSGNGRCISMADAAAEGNANGLAELPHAASTYTAWDGDRVMGCACDAGWTGPDCSEARCPVGADPLVPAAPAVQALSCQCPGGPCNVGAFTLAWGARAVSVLGTAVAGVADESALAAAGSGGAPGESVEARLRDFFPGLVSSVAFTLGAGVAACDEANLVLVTFTLARGDARLLVAAPGTLADALGGTPVLGVATQQRGTAETAPCSRRGSCVNGQCQCMTGFFPSDGNGGPGNLVDCGSRAPLGSNATIAPLTRCPGNPPCSNRGYCDTSGGKLVCRCAVGAHGAACEFASCPLARAWWDQPQPDGSAHALAPCANRGRCRPDGTCACMAGFTGAACDRTACPTADPNSVCSGNGRCVTLRDLVRLGSSGGERIGGGAPARQSLACSRASGLLYFTLSYARSQAIPWDATLADFALALENLATVAHVEVLARPRAALAGFESPQRICSGEGGAAEPVVVEVTFVDAAGVVPPLSLEVADADPSDTGSAAVAVLEPGSLPSYGADPFAAATWDAGMLSACHCDGYPAWNATSTDPAEADGGEWFGPACSLRRCPAGMDPHSCGDAPALEVQRLSCAAAAGSFALSFRGRSTGPLDFAATAAEIAAALQALPSVGLVAVSQEQPTLDGAGACGATPRATMVTFLTELGNLPPLRVDARLLFSPAPGGAEVAVEEVVQGAGLVAECAGRGVCDNSAGLCACAASYESSNGLRLPGRRGDCGSVVRAV